MNHSVTIGIKERIGNCELMVKSADRHIMALKVRRDARIHVVCHIHVVEVKIHIDVEVVVSHHLAQSRKHSRRKNRVWDLDRHIFEGVSLRRIGLGIVVSVARLHFDLTFSRILLGVGLYLLARILDDFNRQILFNVVLRCFKYTGANFTHHFGLIFNENR
jgi:hypothetical protein